MKKIIIVTGNSGAGKSTTIKPLFKDNEIQKNYHKIPIVTTRRQRNNEIEGEEYNFVTKTVFNTLINNDEFFYWATYNNYYYGIKNREIKKTEKMGKIPLVTTILKPAVALCHSFSSYLILFIRLETETKSQLEVQIKDRAKMRGTEQTIEQIIRQLDEPTNLTVPNRVTEKRIINKFNCQSETVTAIKKELINFVQLNFLPEEKDINNENTVLHAKNLNFVA